MKKIAVTGGIGSGKSLVMKYISEMGYPTFSCDEINCELLTDPDYIIKLKQSFPSVVNDEVINKNLLRNIVFQNPNERKRLNDIAHPIIMDRLLSKMNGVKQGIAFAEVPLLFEQRLESLFDEIIVVLRDKSNRVDAIKKRDQLSDGEIENRISAQFDYNNLTNRIKGLTVHIINNNSAKSLLKEQIVRCLANIVKQ